MRLHSLSSIAASLLLVGCVGEYTSGDQGGGGGGGGGGDATALELYNGLNDQQIAECGSCHMGTNLDDTQTGPDYLGPDSGASYETIMAYKSWEDGSPIVGNSPENSKLLLKGSHTGPAMSRPRSQTISTDASTACTTATSTKASP